MWQRVALAQALLAGSMCTKGHRGSGCYTTANDLEHARTTAPYRTSSQIVNAAIADVDLKTQHSKPNNARNANNLLAEQTAHNEQPSLQRLAFVLDPFHSNTTCPLVPTFFVVAHMLRHRHLTDNPLSGHSKLRSS